MTNFDQSNSAEKIALDKVIKKSRVHFYKPVQIAEILFRDRVHKDIDLADLETYRNASKRWRDEVCARLVGRVSTSSQKFQDNLFERNALPPETIIKLGAINRESGGDVERYIYGCFRAKLSRLGSALGYCEVTPPDQFVLEEFLSPFHNEAGLRRSIDKVYEIIVYSLFSCLVDAMQVEIRIEVKQPNNPILAEFDDFSSKVLGFDRTLSPTRYPARLFRVGVTNAADRGLDMWANFGLAIQIKHLSLTETVAEDVADAISADRVIIVCKDAEEATISSLLSQIGWRGKIQAVITLGELKAWYEKALRGKYAAKLGTKVVSALANQLTLEFPSTAQNIMGDLFSNRNYH